LFHDPKPSQGYQTIENLKERGSLEGVGGAFGRHGGAFGRHGRVFKRREAKKESFSNFR
jgi:hypothetical protein